MSIFGTAACFIGFHDWGHWSYTDNPQKLCEQVHECQREGCGARELRIEHTWDEWRYMQENSCDQERVCNHCKQKETQKDKHIWGEWRYIQENSCDQERVCSHCKNRETRADQHDWTEWAYHMGEKSCEQKRVCRHCNKEQTRLEHYGFEWVYNG